MRDFIELRTEDACETLFKSDDLEIRKTIEHLSDVVDDLSGYIDKPLQDIVQDGFNF